MPAERDTNAYVRRFWFDQPEVHLAIFAFFFSFVWEMWQMPYYNMANVSFQTTTATCTLATVGDALLMVFSYSIVSLVARCRRWLLSPRPWMIGVYLIIGLTITVLFEALATRADWGWTYSDRMLLLPETRIAIGPLIMWTILPLLALVFARRQPLSPQVRLLPRGVA